MFLFSICFFFFFKQKTAYEMRISDWSSDVCSSDLLEMWHEPPFDPATIDKELGWAAGIGMNTMRVFLHNLLWENDPEDLQKRINVFVAIAAKHKIKIQFVLFDSVWDPHTAYGLTSPPSPGAPNSRRETGLAALRD